MPTKKQIEDAVVDKAITKIRDRKPATKPDLLDEQAIAEIEARANGATDGPWEYAPFAISLPRIGGPSRSLIVELPDHVRPLTEAQAVQCEADYKFMAHARTDIPALCQTVRVLLDREMKYARVLSDRLREMDALGKWVSCASDEDDDSPQCGDCRSCFAAESAALRDQLAQVEKELSEEKRLRSELKQIAQIGIEEVSSVGSALQANAVRDATERAATRMRDKCVAKVKAIHEERLRDLRALTEKGEIEHEDAEYERAVLFVLGNVIDALSSLTLDQVE